MCDAAVGESTVHFTPVAVKSKLPDSDHRALADGRCAAE